MKSLIISLFLLAASRPLIAGSVLPSNLGDGDPCLCIAYYSTNEWVVFIDESLKKEWKPGEQKDWIQWDQWIPRYADKPIKILGGHNIQSMDSHAYAQNLFPFDDQTVFACEIGDPNNIIGLPRATRVFSTNGLVSHDVDTLARAEYGLGTNQWFLGKIGTNIFYNETGRPNVVYFRTAQEKLAVNYFQLPKENNIVWGVKKALDAGKDVGFCTDREHTWLERWKDTIWAPRALPAFIESSLKDAKHQKLPKHLARN